MQPCGRTKWPLAARFVLAVAQIVVLLACMPLPAAAAEQGREFMKGSTCIDAAVAEYINALEHQEDSDKAGNAAGAGADATHTAHSTDSHCLHAEQTDWEEGTVLEPFPPEIQALAMSDPESNLFAVEDDGLHADHAIEVSQQDTDRTAAVTRALPSIARRGLLHGGHQNRQKFSNVCPLCRTVVCHWEDVGRL